MELFFHPGALFLTACSAFSRSYVSIFIAEVSHPCLYTTSGMVSVHNNTEQLVEASYTYLSTTSLVCGLS
jgi:hypothetical protein